MDNFNGIVHKIPRTFINSSLLMEELRAPGIYILLGTVPNQFKAYIGESEDVFTRLKEHDKDGKKGWFSEIIVITANRGFLNKAKIKYLENTFYYIAKNAQRYEINQTTPQKSKLSNSDEGTLIEFIDKTKLLVAAFGYKIFEEINVKPFFEERQLFYYKKGRCKLTKLNPFYKGRGFFLNKL